MSGFYGAYGVGIRGPVADDAGGARVGVAGGEVRDGVAELVPG